MNKALLSSNKMDWQTPKNLYEYLDKIFEFDFDPCPVDPTFDGLTIEWGQSNFVNPPYGREIIHWIKKAYEEALKGKRMVLLIPSRTDTEYWHKYIMQATSIGLIQGRLCFNDGKGRAPFPSAIVLFDFNLPKPRHENSPGFFSFEMIPYYCKEQEVKNVCQRCNGTGTAQVDWKGEAGEVIGLSVPCRDCHGTGSIKAKAFFRANR
jgi:site-specific DNA-methyltransferase (adenine-specific)